MARPMEHRKGIKMPAHIKHFDRDKALKAIVATPPNAAEVADYLHTR